jgi:DNA-binding MarR family transcriptional regulator
MSTSIVTLGRECSVCCWFMVPKSEAELIDHVAVLGLRTDDLGLLYQRGVRETAGALLSPRSLAGSETCVAMRAVTDAFVDLGDRLYAVTGLDGSLRPLRPLRERRAGVPLRELRGHLAIALDGRDPMTFLEERERDGVLVRRDVRSDRDDRDDRAGERGHDGEPGAGGDAAPDGDGEGDGDPEGRDDGARDIVVGLTEQGHRAFDDYLRRLAEAQAPLLAGIEADQLDVVRHVCLSVTANTVRRRPADGNETGRDGAPVEGRTAPRLVREGGRHVDAARREFVGSLEPGRVRTLETMHALTVAATAAPRLPLPADRQALPLWWLYQQPAGIPRGPIVDTIGRDGTRTLDELVRAGIVTRAPDSTGADTNVLRLGDKGDRMMADLVRGISRDMAAMFEGIDLADVAMTRDGCWRIALNARRGVLDGVV